MHFYTIEGGKSCWWNGKIKGTFSMAISFIITIINISQLVVVIDVTKNRF